MDPYEDDYEQEEKIETHQRNVFELVPTTRSRPKKKQPPTVGGIFNSTYEIIDKNGNETTKEGPLILL
jgi:hypothetical protein